MVQGTRQLQTGLLNKHLVQMYLYPLLQGYRQYLKHTFTPSVTFTCYTFRITMLQSGCFNRIISLYISIYLQPGILVQNSHDSASDSICFKSWTSQGEADTIWDEGRRGCPKSMTCRWHLTSEWCVQDRGLKYGLGHYWKYHNWTR